MTMTLQPSTLVSAKDSSSGFGTKSKDSSKIDKGTSKSVDTPTGGGDSGSSSPSHSDFSPSSQPTYTLTSQPPDIQTKTIVPSPTDGGNIRSYLTITSS